MVKQILANPNNWFPPVDQVDRPYFIAIDKQNRVFSEYTNFNVLHPVTSPENNWYEHVDKGNVSFFIIKGRFGYYWLDMESGLIFIAAQHEEGSHPLRQYVLSVEIEGQLLTGKFAPDSEHIPLPYKLKHFKLNEQSMMGGDRNEQNMVIQGMNTTGVNPPVRSRVLEVGFGWELNDPKLGRVTFEGLVANRTPQFDLRLLYSLQPDSTVSEQEISFRLLMWDAQTNKEKFLVKKALVKKGVRVRWQEKIL